MNMRNRRRRHPFANHLRRWERSESDDHFDIALSTDRTKECVSVGNNATVLNSASAPWVSEHRPAEFLGQKQNCTRVVDAASGDDEAARRQCPGVCKRVAEIDNGVLRVVERGQVGWSTNEWFVEREIAVHRTRISAGGRPPGASR
jgi:hypothetical protein